MPSPPTGTIVSLITEEEIRARTLELAVEMARTLPEDMLIVALLRGSFIFAADLLRALHSVGARPQVDFMTLSSYGASLTSSGNITVHRDIAEEVGGRHILLLDDILESGRTLTFAYQELLKRGAKDISIAVLLEKPGKRAPGIAVKADFVGFTIPDKFVVGYGLDCANYFRELPFIGVLEQ